MVPMGKTTFRNVITFRSDRFKDPDADLHSHKEQFGQESFGEDVARWLQDRLRSRNVQADGITAEGTGWESYFTTAGTKHGVFFVRASNGPPDLWIAWVFQHKRNLLSPLFGPVRSRPAGALSIVFEIFDCAGEVNDVRWHYRRLFGREPSGNGPWAQTPFE